MDCVRFRVTIVGCSILHLYHNSVPAFYCCGSASSKPAFEVHVKETILNPPCICFGDHARLAAGRPPVAVSRLPAGLSRG